MKAAIILIVSALVLTACMKLPVDVPTATPAVYSVTYKVTGTASKASLTYQNAQGGTEQTKTDVPWQKTMSVKRGDFLYVSAQNEGKTGTIGCEIWVNGAKFKASTSSGAYVIASCSGSAGRD